MIDAKEEETFKESVLTEKTASEKIKRKPFKKLMNFRFSVFAVGATIAGIFCARNYLLGRFVSTAVFLSLFLVTCAVFLIFYTDKSCRGKNFLFAFVFCLFSVAGAAGFTAQYKAFCARGLGGHYYTVTGKVGLKTQSSYGSVLEIKNAYVEGVDKGKTDYKIVVSAEGETPADVGDEIRFYALLTEYSAIYDGDFAASRVSEGVKYHARINASDIEISQNSPDIFQAANLFIKRALERGMTGNEFGVAYAMLTGGSEFIEKEVLSAYRDLGIAHIFAVSGLHIGFFAAALSFLLKKCGVNRFAVAAIVVLSSFFYSGVCGFSSSSLRAAIMCSASFAARLLGKRYDGLSALGFAAVVILLFNPAELFTAGFALSFIIVAGLLVFAPALSRFLSRFLPKKLASSFAAVIAAFAFSLPVLLWAFGEVSVLSVLANLIFLPVAGALYVALFAFAVLAGIFGANAVFLFLPAKAISVLNAVVTKVGSAAVVATGTAFGGAAVFYYAFLTTSSGIFNLKLAARAAISVSLAIVFAISATAVYAANAGRSEIYLFGNGKVSAAIIKTPQGNSLVLAEDKEVFSPSVVFRAATKKGITRFDTLYILNGENHADAQVALSVLLYGVTIEKAVYYGERDEMLEKIIEKSFGNVSAFSAKDGEVVSGGGVRFSYAAGGFAAEIKSAEFFGAIIGRIGESHAKISELGGGYDFVVCCDYAETVNALFAPREFYTFLYSERFTNVISSGIISLRF